MLLSDFNYHLPEELIAQTPLEPRDSSRLLLVEKSPSSTCPTSPTFVPGLGLGGRIEAGEDKTEEFQEDIFSHIVNYLGKNDILVVNKTQVIKARIHGFTHLTNRNGQTHTREVEVFLVRQYGLDVWDCMVYPARRLPAEKVIWFENSLGETILEAQVQETTYTGRKLLFSKGGFEFLQVLEQIGEVPLPPYVLKKLENSERYQSIFHEISGSVAAPTASLHFTQELLQQLEEKGVIIEKVLLHIGPGTFKPVETEHIEDFQIHSEYIELEKEVASRLNNYKKEGKRIIAVGTTSVRVLESFADFSGELGYGTKDTQIFIYPGYDWRFVDSLITNFHLPKSSLLMLVASIAGRENILAAYNYAVKEKFRFFSFGDAMWIQ